MKKIYYKAIAVVLCMIMALGLSACGGKKNASETAAASSQAELAETAEAGAESSAAGTESVSAAESSAETAAQEETADCAPAVVTIYSTNDIHGVVAESPDDGMIGLPQVAGIAASTENSILLDAGDATQGASFATVDNGAYVIDVMNAAGYAAMAAGNHDFDYGAESLLANAEKAQFPILSANTLKDGKPLLDHHIIIEKAGYQIGVIGLTTASTSTSTNPAKLQGVTFENEIETAKAEIGEIADSVDAIVLVTHLGDNALATDVTSQQLLEDLSSEKLRRSPPS